jgi:hypothetical protein
MIRLGPRRGVGISNGTVVSQGPGPRLLEALNHLAAAVWALGDATPRLSGHGEASACELKHELEYGIRRLRNLALLHGADPAQVENVENPETTPGRASARGCLHPRVPTHSARHFVPQWGGSHGTAQHY